MKIESPKVRVRQLASIIIIISSLSYSMMSIAQVYKWTDADGTTHYTQTPPPKDIEAIKIKSPPPVDTESANEELRLKKKRLDKTREQRLKHAEKREKEEQEKKLADQNCQRARARLATYQKPRVNLVDEAGNYTKITEEERLSELTKSKDLVDEHCD